MNPHRYKVGQRLKLTQDSNVIDNQGAWHTVPNGTTCEVLALEQSHMGVPTYDLRMAWRKADGSLRDIRANGMPETLLALGRGRLFFPGEAPPRKGQSFGLTGVNNDYAKQRKQGKRPASAKPLKANPNLSPSPTMIVTAPNAAPPVALTPEQAHMAGQSCPHCAATTPATVGTLVELRGNLARGPKAGQPYVILKCTHCGARVKKDGAVQHTAPGGAMTVYPAAPVLATAAAATAATAEALTAALTATTAEPPAPAAIKTAPPAFVFPLTKAMKVAADVRKMAQQGTTDMTFSLRKLLAWTTASAAFAAQGVPEGDAVTAGFLCTALDRETDQSRLKLAQLFQSVFGTDPLKTPRKHPALSNDSVIDMALSHGLNLWISGPTGCGKTHSVLAQMRAQNRRYVRVQGGGDVTRETMVGYPALTNGSSSFKAGPLTYAMEHGIVLVLDEIDKLRDEVLSELTAVLEGNGLVLMDDSGREVAPAPGFAVVATANTVGRGEGLLYGGTKTVNEALRDRFIFLTVDYDNNADQAIVAKHAKNLGIRTA